MERGLLLVGACWETVEKSNYKLQSWFVCYGKLWKAAQSSSTFFSGERRLSSVAFLSTLIVLSRRFSQSLLGRFDYLPVGSPGGRPDTVLNCLRLSRWLEEPFSLKKVVPFCGGFSFIRKGRPFMRLYK